MSGLTFEFDREDEPVARIKVIGVGGAGGNAVNRMVDSGLSRVEFIAINTDEQVLQKSRASTQIAIGANVTKGLGAGGDPAVGRQAVEEDIDRVTEALRGADMVFVTAGMGGGTGTGASPVVAEIAAQQGALTVGVVTTPFRFEQKKRTQRAIDGVRALREKVDTLIVISNERLMEVFDENMLIDEAFKEADDILKQAVQGITDIILVPGLINLDFADVRSVMSSRGDATMGSGIGKGANRSTEAAEMAISSPLLEDISISGAKGLLVNITSSNLTMRDINTAMAIVNEESGAMADVFVGAVPDENVPEDEVRITVIATGYETSGSHAPLAEPAVLTEPVQGQIDLPESVVQEPVSEPVEAKPEGVQQKAQPAPPVQPVQPVEEHVEEPTNHDDVDIRVPTFIRKTRRNSY